MLLAPDADFPPIEFFDEQGQYQGIAADYAALVEQRLGTRYTATEIVGQNISMLMLEPRRGAHDQYLQNYLSGQVAKIIGSGREVPGRRKDGSTVPLELGASEIAIAIAGRRP